MTAGERQPRVSDEDREPSAEGVITAERDDYDRKPMNFRIPLYVFQHKAGYTARPLFAAAPERTDENLNRLLAKLTRDLVQLLEVLGRKERHDELAAWAFCPPVTA